MKNNILRLCCISSFLARKKSSPSRGTAFLLPVNKPNSVQPQGAAPSFICDLGHPRPVSAYPPTRARNPFAAEAAALVYMTFQLTRFVHRCSCLQPSCALTTRFHPYLRRGGYFLRHLLSDPRPAHSLSGVMRCVVRTFLPCKSRGDEVTSCIFFIRTACMLNKKQYSFLVPKMEVRAKKKQKPTAQAMDFR